MTAADPRAGMRRIAVVGNGGAGKTTLANRLGALLDLPVTHLDALRYTDDWATVDEGTFVDRQRRVVATERWIIDGNSLASLPIRVAAADTVIVVDPPPVVCLWGLLRRRWRYHGGRHPDGVHDRITPAFLRYVWRYRRDHLPGVQACVAEHGGDAEVIHLTSHVRVDLFYEGLAHHLGRGAR
ncbi:topology modulation protein [Actinoplanes regularis]|uniref:Adenylate kinase n=1 Tax=Actinoplanes regularis TaxID=52697 RepID=A0A239FQV7_9ACTN|nr:topology modulation protein [Actinoplanes regularis]GIE90174.1 topology modulation protein [Actinoplanes regularis]SNS59327.1 Adenylate kinase [Actinoplanes regularis]